MALVFLIQFLAVFRTWETRKKRMSHSLFSLVFHYVTKGEDLTALFEMPRLQLASSRVVVTFKQKKKK